MTDPRDREVMAAITTPDDTADDARQDARQDDARRAALPRAALGRLTAHTQGAPLQARLVAILVVVLISALTLSSWLVVTFLHRILLSDLDAELKRAAKPVADAAVHGELSGRGGGPFPSEYVAYPVWASGMVDTVKRPDNSNSLPDTDPDFSSVTGSAAGTQRAPFTLPSERGNTRWRAVALALTLKQTDAVTGQQATQIVGTIYVATPLTRVDDTIRSLGVSLAGVALIVTSAGAALGWIAIRRSFRPLIEVEETAAAIAAGDLSRRIPERPASTEVGRLTASLNGMLARIESAFRAQEASEARTRRFAADASHELRTPLVSIRGFAELYRQGAVPPDEVPRTMRRIEDEAKRMGSLVEDLLLLARLDEQRPARKEPVDLLVLAGDAVHDARGLDAERQVRLVGLDGTGPATAVVTGDEDRLRQVVANLVANAVRHTPAGTPVEVAVGTAPAPDGRDGPVAVLEVRDHGPGLTPEQSQRVFERFYRVDSSRRRGAGGGSGLGLSIVSAVVAAHAGSVTVGPTPGGGATFRVMLPLHRTAQDLWGSRV